MHDGGAGFQISVEREREKKRYIWLTGTTVVFVSRERRTESKESGGTVEEDASSLGELSNKLKSDE